METLLWSQSVTVMLPNWLLIESLDAGVVLKSFWDYSRKVWPDRLNETANKHTNTPDLK